MKKKMVLAAVCSAVFPVLAQRPCVGAIRWDAYQGIGPYNDVVAHSLAPEKYRWRAPWFTEVRADGTLSIDGGQAGVMEREIDYAADAGLDYWAFVMYNPAPEVGLSRGIELYLKAPNRHRIDFAVIIHAHKALTAKEWPTERDRWIGCFADQQYVKTPSGRPLVYILNMPVNRLDDFKAHARTAGHNPYYVHISSGWERGEIRDVKPGGDAVGRYASIAEEAMTFVEFAAQSRVRYWEKPAKAGLEVVPVVTTGWEKNPRKDYPPFWELGQSYFTQAGFPAFPTPAEMAKHLGDSLKFVRDNPKSCPADTVLMYAWNEHDEGGWLCPTWTPDGKPDTARLDAVRRVLQPSAGLVPEPKRPKSIPAHAVREHRRFLEEKAHRGAPRPAAMSVLPDGAVQAKAWLRRQLELQRDGLTGHAEELYDDIGNSDWLTRAGKGGQYAWERGPYYAKGLVALAFALDDAVLQAKAKRWVDAILASQRPNGDFGPRERNWWANMIALWLVRDWCAATDDPCVPPFLERYFAFQAQELKRYALADESKWAMARGADELDVVLWLHARTGKTELEAFARLLTGQIASWSTYYHRGGDPSQEGCRSHIVNFMQGVKAPPLQWRVDGDPRHRDAYAAAFAPQGWIMKSFGRPDRMVNGSEPLSSRSASEGTELCAIAERILSNQVALGTWGDAAIGDDLETVAYNTLPATLGADGRGMRYYNVLNLPFCVDGPYGFVNNGEKVGSLCPGPHAGFGCCRSNFHFAWPKFVQSLWMKTAENGLAATAYGPCTVTATAGGVRMTVEETGSYPFGPDVKMVFREGVAKFPLKLRIPGWCRAPQVTVNGEAVADVEPGSFRTVDRAWKPGDEVSLRFPMDVSVSGGWDHGAVAVTRGPLLYALKLACEEKTVASYEVPFEKRTVDDLNGFPRREIRAAEPWNRALVLNAQGGVDAEVVMRDVPLQPFEPGSAPVSLKVKTFRTDFGGWGHTRDLLTARAIEPPPSPITVEGGIQTAELVPMGATQVRIVLFPWARETAE